MTKHTTGRVRRLALPVALSAVAATSFGLLSSGAVFTSSDPVDGNTFTAGTVIIDANRTADFTMPTGNMAPGDTVTGQVTVANTGSLEQRYAVTTSVAGDTALADALQVTVSRAGTPLYTGTLTSFKLGDVLQGAQAGDRTLPAGTNEVLDFSVQLPLSADNTLQAKTTAATFTFDAEQTKNN